MASIRLRKIVPKKRFDSSIWVKEIEKELKGPVTDDITKLLKKPTKSWKSNPSFLSKFKSGSSFLKVTITARKNKDGELYNLLDHGAKRHPITAKKVSGTLWFRPNYRASTSPGSLRSRAASKTGAFINPYAVNHPGFKRRDFYETVSKVYENEFGNRIEAANKRAADKQNS